MWVPLGKLTRDKDGAVAPTVALSLFGLIAVGGIAFDYAQLAALDTELQQAADQAALAAATQLDGGLNARARATAAAKQIVANVGLFANRNQNHNLDVATVAFCSAYNDSLPNNPADPPTAPTGCTVATSDADAKIAVVTMGTRKAFYSLTPVVGALNSGDLTAQAAAHVGSAICKVPPVMICNPDEPSNNTNELLDFNPARGTGLRLVTGSADAPGNFGWLEAGLGNGTQALAGELGYNVPLGPCQAITGVTTKTGMDTAVLAAFNTRFDVYTNGNTTCPNQGGGSCNPAVNTRKDLTCEYNSTTTCKNNATWNPVTYDPPYNNGVPQALPATPADPITGRGPQDPTIMGYPHDICHSGLRSKQTCGIVGSAVWDVNAYFRVNYGMNATEWRNAMGAPYSGTSQIPARYDVYQWELKNSNVGGKGIGVYQPLPSPSKDAAFSFPASGNGNGVPASSSQPDRRTIAVAVLNCQALNAHGKTTNVPVPTWLKVFLVEPAISRPGPASDEYTDQKDIYVEFVEKSQAQNNEFEQVVRRDVPYLIK